MKNRTDLINYIATKICAISYCEIGVQNVMNNFAHINVAYKIGVDPMGGGDGIRMMTSDKFFEQNRQHFNIFLIDGLHHEHQVGKDIINAWRCLTVNGVIVVHDCSPATEDITIVPRRTKVWTGDVYKFVSRIYKEENSKTVFTVDMDFGCMVIKKIEIPLSFTGAKITWKHFSENRKQLLNLVSVEDAIKIIDGWN